MTKIYRQGDIILEATQPQGIGGLEVKTLELAGETGKPHTITGRTNGQTLVLEEPTQLKHEQHGNMQIPAGTYEIRRNRQWAGSRIRGGMD